jgi:hypothetical protein
MKQKQCNKYKPGEEMNINEIEARWKLPYYNDNKEGQIAHARQDIPDLIARIKELEAENKQLRHGLNSSTRQERRRK